MSTDPKDRWLHLGFFIREQRGSARLSLRRLSELAGISNPYLSQIERGPAKALGRDPPADRQRCASPPRRFTCRPGSSNLVWDADLTRAIMADQSISEEQKQALVRIYLSFRRYPREELGTSRARRSRPQPADGTCTCPSHADADAEHVTAKKPRDKRKKMKPGRLAVAVFAAAGRLLTAMRRLAVLSLHTSPLAQPGTGTVAA